MRRLLSVLSTMIVIVVGFLTLLGLQAGDNLGFLSALTAYAGVPVLTSVFLQLVTLTVATTIFVGLLNLIGVHFRRIGSGQTGWPYSVVMLFAMALVLVLTLAERLNWLPQQSGARRATAALLENVQVSVESALAALLLFTLVYGAYRLMRRRVTGAYLLFTGVLLIVLLGALPLPGAGLSLLAQARQWLLAVPAEAGARGLLLGIALATLVAGARVLIGQDRSYRE